MSPKAEEEKIRIKKYVIKLVFILGPLSELVKFHKKTDKAKLTEYKFFGHISRYKLNNIQRWFNKI